MAKIHFGTELYGRFHQRDGTSIATMFFHILYLPLVPLATYRVFSENGPQFRGEKLGLRFGSVLSGYFKVWGFLAALGLVVLGFYNAGRYEIPWAEYVAVPAAGMVLLAAVIASWLWLGTPPRTTGRVRVPLLALGIPLLVLAAGNGYWWWDRIDRDRRIDEMDEREAAKAAAEREEYERRAAEERKAAEARKVLTTLVPVDAGEPVKRRERVLGLFGGKWYAGKVTRSRRDKIKVTWDDGTYSTLTPADVAPMPPPALLEPDAFAICRRTSVGRWYGARIERKEDTYNRVEYSDGTTASIEAGGCVTARPK